MNRVLLVGNLTRDPELSTTNSGVSYCRFGIAVSRRFKNANGEREADFLNVIVWRAQAENCHKYLKKGSKVGIVGSIQTGSYDAQDGTKKYTTDIVADEVEFLNTKPGGGGGDAGDAAAQKPQANEDVAELQPVEDDTMPF